MKRLKGFTLVELVITIAIVIILSVVSVPVYKGYSRNAKLTEGYALLGTIFSWQKNYYSEHGFFFGGTNYVNGLGDFTCYHPISGIDARGNKYFTRFAVGSTSDPSSGFQCETVIPEDLRVSRNNVIVLRYSLTVEGGARILETVSSYFN